jgi:hypothetical protein
MSALRPQGAVCNTFRPKGEVFMNTQVLRQKLSEFGLNPEEWALQVACRLGRRVQIDIRSRKDPLFSFQGWAEGQHWLSIGIS